MSNSPNAGGDDFGGYPGPREMNRISQVRLVVLKAPGAEPVNRENPAGLTGRTRTTAIVELRLKKYPLRKR